MKSWKWIQAYEQSVPAKQVTRLWHIRSIEADYHLGSIKWHTGWRRYAFFPAAETLFEEDCLRDIADFLDDATASRRADRAAERALEKQQ